MSNDRNSTILAIGLAAVGAAALAVLFVVQSDPSPLWLWATFAGAYVGLEFSAVEVNDRLLISSSIMVAFTAAVVFGRDSAVLAVALMAAITVLHPDDLRQRRWRQPAVNFGQLVLSAVVGLTTFYPFLPVGELTATDLPRIAIGAAVAAGTYSVVNFRLVKFIVGRLYPDRKLGPWSAMTVNHAALALLGAYGGVLGAAYVLAGPVTIPLMLITFLIGHVGFSSYSQLRDAYRSTILGLIKAVEAMDPYTKGHTDRVAHFTRMTGETLGLGADRLQSLQWAALIHDVGKVAVPPALLHKRSMLDDDEYSRVVRHMRTVESVLSEVEFLAPMVEIASAPHLVFEGRLDEIPLEGRILAVADAFDAMTSTRSYRSAVTQDQAFTELRRRADAYGEDVVEALIGSITERGEVYGSPDEASAAEVERLVHERSIRA